MIAVVVIVIVSLLLVWSGTGAYAMSVSPSVPFLSLFRDSARKWGVPLRLMVAIAAHESNFRPDAVNRETAADAKRGRDVDSLGIGQILFPDTAHDYDPFLNREDLFDPAVNINVMGFILARHWKRHPVPESVFPADVVSAYNGGHSLRVGEGFANQDYVDKVRVQWGRYANVA